MGYELKANLELNGYFPGHVGFLEQTYLTTLHESMELYKGCLHCVQSSTTGRGSTPKIRGVAGTLIDPCGSAAFIIKG